MGSGGRVAGTGTCAADPAKHKPQGRSPGSKTAASVAELHYSECLSMCMMCLCLCLRLCLCAHAHAHTGPHLERHQLPHPLHFQRCLSLRRRRLHLQQSKVAGTLTAQQMMRATAMYRAPRGLHTSRFHELCAARYASFLFRRSSSIMRSLMDLHSCTRDRCGVGGGVAAHFMGTCTSRNAISKVKALLTAERCPHGQ